MCVCGVCLCVMHMARMLCIMCCAHIACVSRARGGMGGQARGAAGQSQILEKPQCADPRILGSLL